MKLTILSTSDTHGYIEPTNYIKKNSQMNFGLEKAATTINKIKQNNPYTITIDNGDFLEGSPLAYYLAKVNQPNSPKPLSDAFNQINYDFGIIGNHEFNYGINYLNSAISTSKRQFLCANILKNNKPCFGLPYQIKIINNVKVAVIGLTTQGVCKWQNNDLLNGLSIKSGVDTLKKYLPEMKQKADVIIVSYHGGLERDADGHEIEDLNGENEGYQILKEFPEIDALVTGHQHRKIADKLFNTPYTQPGKRGEYIGQIDLEIEKDNGIYQVINSDCKLVNTGQETENLNIKKQIKPIHDQLEEWLSMPLAVINGSMKYDDPFKARLQGNAFINFVQKIQMKTMKVDISATALFTNEAYGFENPITMRNIMTNYIYPNSLATLKITGQDLKDAIEKSSNYFIVENDKIKVNPDYIYPKRRDYNYDMFAGVEYTLKISNPIGQRVIELLYHGKPIEMNQEYKIALNAYRAVGGKRYPMYNESKIINQNPITMSQLIADYLRKNKLIDADNQSNFKIIK
ncbi:bifunctional metallophosphatase/5'-nucleotidase [Lactobacillus sp. S2-2]|uniref:bifunctional metallophosphatase/5'-nucleotidase n=1 Tax=Lactobacillus sp. S2-2 TaxID=2692917 RepID=UPI001F20E6C1|nr:bifunctional UDP-sugar hydrolase/5'-nucleotidase [Lactobacillus sp. S2-2]MCF6515270.1 bifunctional metallophosphatase/5'-nucleotidase [Lactobacillus sp. S2-2]